MVSAQGKAAVLTGVGRAESPVAWWLLPAGSFGAVWPPTRGPSGPIMG